MTPQFGQTLVRWGRPLWALSAALLILMAVGCDGGCGGSGGAKAPTAKSSGMKNMALKVPADTQVSVIIGDLKDMRESLNTARDTLGDALPLRDLIEEQVKNELGIDVFQADSWKQAGISPDGALSMNVVGQRVVLLTHVSDKQKFEQALTKRLENSLGLSGTAKNAKEGSTNVKVLGEGDDAVAWAYASDMVTVVFPPNSEIEALPADEDTSDAVKLAARLVTLESEKSLAEVEGFKRFQKALANQDSVAVYINRDTVFSDARMADYAEGPSAQKAISQWMKKNVRAVGLGFSVKDNSLRARLWSDLPDEVLKSAREIVNPPGGFALKHFTTENTLIGLRIAVDMPKFWTFYKNELMNQTDRQRLDEQLQRAGAQANLNIEDDIINQLTGNVAVLLYGLDLERLEEIGNPMAAATSGFAETVALLAPLEFKDKAGAQKVLNSIEEAGEGVLVKQDLADGVEVLRVRNTTLNYGSIYRKDNLLVYSTDTFSDESVGQYIQGKREEKVLGENKALDLGKDFANEKTYNGLYVNFLRAQNHLGGLLAQQFPPAVEFLNKMEEAALSAELGDEGAYINLTFDLTPQPKATDTKTDSNQDK